MGLTMMVLLLCQRLSNMAELPKAREDCERASCNNSGDQFSTLTFPIVGDIRSAVRVSSGYGCECNRHLDRASCLEFGKPVLRPSFDLSQSVPSTSPKAFLSPDPELPPLVRLQGYIKGVWVFGLQSLQRRIVRVHSLLRSVEIIGIWAAGTEFCFRSPA